MITRHFAFLAVSVLAACSSLPSRLKPYRESPPLRLLAEVDRQVYTPASRGLQRMEADLFIDVAGFAEAKARSKGPLWVLVHFRWENGAAKYEPRNWPASAAPLQKRVVAMLQGKEDDLVGRPFTDRLNGFRMTIEEGDDGLLWLIAAHPSDKERRLRLGIDGDFHVRRAVVEVNDREIASEIAYGPGSPAVMTGVATQESGGQPAHTSVRYEYGRAGKFTLPTKLVYQTTVGQLPFPALTIEIKNIKVE